MKVDYSVVWMEPYWAENSVDETVDETVDELVVWLVEVWVDLMVFSRAGS